MTRFDLSSCIMEGRAAPAFEIGTGLAKPICTPGEHHKVKQKGTVVFLVCDRALQMPMLQSYQIEGARKK